MGIIYVTTHLAMAVCVISILYLSLKPNETISEQEKLSLTDRIYTRGLKLIEVIARTGYRIAASILISYLK
jgi:hypothetical protein